ncbi:MAG TPA: hypothetical protein VLX92_04570 [Kofleriaceae bacterium]|nr:hypothetical protein [Kofleriaceae bacterium]
MKPQWILASMFTGALIAPAAIAQPRHDSHPAPRPASAPRGKEAGARFVGSHSVAHPERPMTPRDNPAHEYVVRDGRGHDEHHAVIVDHRPPHVRDRDPRLRVVVRGYHPAHDWGRFHRLHGGWWHMWGITAWDTVGTVTCEAANETTGEIYPVSEDRDARGWDDDTVNAILDQALDDCEAEAGGAVCGPVATPCTFQPY